jgi:hypothetical protein
MRDTHRAVGYINVLTTCTRRAIRIDTQVLVLNIDLDVLIDLR